MADAPKTTLMLDDSEGELVGVLGALASVLRDRAASAVVQITGPRGGEGASAIALSLARAIETGLSERACVLHVFGGTPAEGYSGDAGPLREYLGDEDRRAIAQGELSRIVQRMSNNCRIFIVDSGPILTTPLAGFVADQVDGSILVIEARRTTVADARQAQAAVERGGGRVLGVLLNKRTYSVPGFIAWLLGLPRRPKRRRRAGPPR